MADETPDTYDPCTAYVELRNAYHSILKGEGVRRVRFRNGDDERETEFSQTNIELLRDAMSQAQRECMAKTTGRSSRSAIGIGFQNPVGGGRIF